MKKFFLLSLFCFFASGTLDAQSGTIGTTLEWNIINEELVITGIGELPDFVFGESENIPWYVFRDDIKTIRINDGVTYIGQYSFYNLTNAVSVIIPGTVIKICINAFLECSLPSISIPVSVRNIDNLFVQNCHAMTDILVDPGNPYFSSEDGVLYNKNKTILHTCPAGKQGSHSIPKSVTAINGYAYYHSMLSSVTIPASVITIQDQAFRDCPNLTEIVNENSIPQKISSNAFFGFDFENGILRVPAASVGLYKASEGWQKFNNIEGINMIALDYSSIYLLVGAGKTLSAMFDEHSPETQIEWTSNNAAVATINSAGKLMAISPGKTEITVSAFGNEATCTVTVIQRGNSIISGNVGNNGTGIARVNLFTKLPDSNTN
jgi:hypothetical protein